MVKSQFIGRTEKVNKLRKILKEEQAVYLTSCFYSGKTVLMDQLAEGLPDPVLRFVPGRDDPQAFARRALEQPKAVLMIDDIQRIIRSGEEGPFASFLERIPDSQRVVLAGRAQYPQCLTQYIIRGNIRVLNKEFIMFDAAEIEQLFLNYGVHLIPSDIEWLLKTSEGFSFALHATAQKMHAEKGKSVRIRYREVIDMIKQHLVSEAIQEFDEAERFILYNLSPFERFTGDMARMITGKNDAPVLMKRIVNNSYALMMDAPDSFYFDPIVREPLFQEMKDLYPKEYLEGHYRRAAQYYEISNRIPDAISYYLKLDDTDKIRELLIRDTRMRPANGDYTGLRHAYARLSEESILSSPELMKGICLVESLQGHADESERWYRELIGFIQRTPEEDPRRSAAEEAAAYLNIALSCRGTKDFFRTVMEIAKDERFTGSDTWKTGFNVAGNTVSVINGGKDFCRWVPHTQWIHGIAGSSIEKALGRAGAGLADLAYGESLFESDLSGDYTLALETVTAGIARMTQDTELRCAGIGIRSRILMAEGNSEDALRMMENLLEHLSGDAPRRLRENMDVYRMTLLLMRGETQEPLSWMDTDAPDETEAFLVLDRHKLILKLRLYIILSRWQKTLLPISQLKQYAERYDRPYHRIQLHLLQAIIYRRTGDDAWRGEMEKALSMAKRYRLARVIADEGIAILGMLKDMKLGDGPWEKGIMNLTRRHAALYPLYMKPAPERPDFSEREYEVYSLIAAGYKNAEIAEILGLTERTVKHYAGEVYHKLGVTNRGEAISRAVDLGDAQRQTDR